MIAQAHYFVLAFIMIMSVVSAALVRFAVQVQDSNWMLLAVVLLIVVPGVILVVALSIVWARNETAWRQVVLKQQDDNRLSYEKVIAEQQATFTTTIKSMRDEHVLAIQSMSETQRAAYEESMAVWLEAALKQKIAAENK